MSYIDLRLLFTVISYTYINLLLCITKAYAETYRKFVADALYVMPWFVDENGIDTKLKLNHVYLNCLIAKFN
jgi:hypothetical protein